MTLLPCVVRPTWTVINIVVGKGIGMGVELIVAALAAGASAGVAGTATQAITDTYGLLKQLLKRRFGGREQAREALEAQETEPGVWQTRIGDDLRQSGAAEDEQILAAARELIALADPKTAAMFHIGTVHGAAGQFYAPVTIDQRTQGPGAGRSPASPAAG
ncbi:hypothetical protein ACFQ1L_13380 [Phytohabitans flavus]|uniref:hypothetical protein n=1 Tax=Phytohabitans flavus TaxID=1076124 RepID=UPI00362F950C